MRALLAQWFLRKRLLNDPSSCLQYCYYLPFGEDLALYLKNNFKFPLFKDNLYQVLSLYARVICTKFD
jgi:hypothetical protein